MGIIGHILRRSENHVFPFVQRLLSRVQPVIHLCEIDRVRLLPDQVSVRTTGPLAVEIGRTLGPFSTTASHALGPLDRCRQEIGKYVQALIEQVPAVPQPVVHAVPPDHFEMETSVPAVIDQSALLGRQYTCFVHTHHVLRKHDTAFQLFPAGIRTSRQVDRCSRLPKSFPGFGAGLIDLVGCRKLIRGHFFR